MGENMKKFKFKKLFNIVFYFLLISYVILQSFFAYGGHEEERAAIKEAYDNGQIDEDYYNDLMEMYDEYDDAEEKRTKWEDEDHEKLGKETAEGVKKTAFWDLPGMLLNAVIKGMKNVFNWLFTTILKGVLAIILELYKIFAGELFHAASGTFYPESQNGTLSTVYGMLNNTVRTISLSLLILMALYKGFTTYILWKDGNPEENPMEIIMRYMFAVAMLFSFNELYEIAAGVIGSLNVSVGGSIGSIKSSPFDMDNIENIAQAIMTIIIVITLLKQSMSAVFALIGKNVEMLILRVGFPLACVSAITPQASGFKNYITSMLKGMLTIVVMNVLISMSIRIISEDTNLINMIWGIAILQLVNHGGSIINSIVATGGGGGAGDSLGGGLVGAGSDGMKAGTTGIKKIGKSIIGGIAGGPAGAAAGAAS